MLLPNSFHQFLKALDLIAVAPIKSDYYPESNKSLDLYSMKCTLANDINRADPTEKKFMLWVAKMKTREVLETNGRNYFELFGKAKDVWACLPSEDDTPTYVEFGTLYERINPTGPIKLPIPSKKCLYWIFNSSDSRRIEEVQSEAAKQSWKKTKELLEKNLIPSLDAIERTYLTVCNAEEPDIVYKSVPMLNYFHRTVDNVKVSADSDNTVPARHSKKRMFLAAKTASSKLTLADWKKILSIEIFSGTRLVRWSSETDLTNNALKLFKSASNAQSGGDDNRVQLAVEVKYWKLLLFWLERKRLIRGSLNIMDKLRVYSEHGSKPISRKSFNSVELRDKKDSPNFQEKIFQLFDGNNVEVSNDCSDIMRAAVQLDNKMRKICRRLL